MKPMINFKGVAGVIHQQTHSPNLMYIYALLIYMYFSYMHTCIHPFHFSDPGHNLLLEIMINYVKIIVIMYLMKQPRWFKGCHVDGHRHCSCTLTSKCNPTWVTSKVANFISHPLESQALVLKQKYNNIKVYTYSTCMHITLYWLNVLAVLTP